MSNRCMGNGSPSKRPSGEDEIAVLSRGERMAEVMVPVDIPLLGDERRKNWAKVVRSVDDAKSSGWAFTGEFISVGGIQDVPAGAVILVYGERGSAASPNVEARLYVANADGTLTHQQTARGRAWARTLRDKVAELLAAEVAGVTGLEHLPDGLLIAELESRGYRVRANG